MQRQQYYYWILLLGSNWRKNRIFKGNFNGQNHTIHNFISRRHGEFSPTKFQTGTYDIRVYGFFTAILGEISDLRLKDFEIHKESGTSSRAEFTGGVAGVGDPGSKISRCVVENFKIISENNHKYANSGIIGFHTGATIDLCYVDLTTYSGNQVISYSIGAISSGDTKLLSRINGIGKRTAERIVVELKDKVNRISGVETPAAQGQNPAISDAAMALETLGFKRDAVNKVINALLTELPPEQHNTEQLVRIAIARLNF